MKLVLNNFEGGISNSSKINIEGQYAWAENIDVRKNFGYLGGGLSPTALSGSAAHVDDLIVDISEPFPDSSVREMFAIDRNNADGNCKLYHINGDTNTVTTNASFPRTVSPTGAGVLNYYSNVSGAAAWSLFYILTSTVGRMIIGLTFDDDYMSTVPAGTAAFSNTNSNHPYIVWNSILWIGDGRYVYKYDGLTGNEGTVTTQACDAGAGWNIMAIVPTQNYLCLFVSRVYYATTEEIVEPIFTRATLSEAILWDGSSSTFIKRIPLGNGIISGAQNVNGRIYFFYSGSDGKPYLRKLTDTGSEIAKKLDFEEAISFKITRLHASEIYNDDILFGLERAGGSFIGAFGINETTGRETLTMPMMAPWEGSEGIAKKIGAVKAVGNNVFYISSAGADSFQLDYYNANAADSTFKGNYWDFGQKIRINYVKFYFKALVSGDSITPTLEINYGTSVTLTDPNGNTTISYANDGAITEKKFMVKRDCHSVRPILVWGAGSSAVFSKIVIDYSFIQDN